MFTFLRFLAVLIMFTVNIQACGGTVKESTTSKSQGVYTHFDFGQSWLIRYKIETDSVEGCYPLGKEFVFNAKYELTSFIEGQTESVDSTQNHTVTVKLTDVIEKVMIVYSIREMANLSALPDEPIVLSQMFYNNDGVKLFALHVDLIRYEGVNELGLYCFTPELEVVGSG